MRKSLICLFLVTALGLISGIVKIDTASAASASAWPYQVLDQKTGDVAGPALVRLAAGDEASVMAISQKDKAFTPVEASVKVGQVIEIVNDDTTIHNAYCQSPDFKYNSGPQQPGGRSKLVFTAAGTFEVRCAIHPKMKLTVKVTE